ncbi:MAG: hypothetical protein Q4G69_07220 [Planctomycetia bacterium]|nr:hypothetical protein [Planctomycetia bacterium]
MKSPSKNQQGYTQMDVLRNDDVPQNSSESGSDSGNIESLLKNLIAAQNRQNDLLQKMIIIMSAGQQQRDQELFQWKNANPNLARSCRNAADKLAQIQTDVISAAADEVDLKFEDMVDNEYCIGDFLDRYGPRFVHLSAILQLFSLLGNPSDVSSTVRW